MNFTQEIDGKPLLFHHSRNLSHVCLDKMTQWSFSARHFEPDGAHKFKGWDCRCNHCVWMENREFEAAYEWLEKQIGFYPLFLGVGKEVESQRITGYQNGFKQNGFEQQVLFSFFEKPHPSLVMSDYSNWHVVLNSITHDTKSIDEYDWPKNFLNTLFKKGWCEKRWQSYARRMPGCIQATVPFIRGSEADLIRCANQTTQKKLVAMGFDEEKIKVERWKTKEAWEL